MPRAVLPLVAAVALAVSFAPLASAVPVELRGSLPSMERQNRVAVQAGLPFARTFGDIERLVDAGEFVLVTGNESYDLRSGLRSHAARPELRLFIERLAAEYHEATGEKLVVTSLVRPQSSQPRNAHRLSVHPAGIAVDLRISQRQASRAWIERRLLEMERQGLLDITRERHPPHYHVALFPDAYLAYVEEEIGPIKLDIALGQFDKVVEFDEVHEEHFVSLEEPEEIESMRRASVWDFILRIFGRTA